VIARRFNNQQKQKTLQHYACGINDVGKRGNGNFSMAHADGV